MNQSFQPRRLLRTLVCGAGLAAVAGAQTDLYNLVGDGADDRFGECVASAGDVNMDGHPDFLVGASEDNSAFFPENGYVRVYDGVTGAPIRTLLGTVAGAGFGTSTAGIGDANSDGRSDVAVGIPFGGTGGQVQLFSGADGSLLWTFTSTVASARIGSAVAAAGDVNGDGSMDVIVGGLRSSVGGTNSGQALVLSGVDGAILYNLSGAAQQQFGVAVCGLGDLDNDGRADFAVGARAGSTKVYSGINGSVMWTFNQPSGSDHYGWSIAAAGDIDNDGEIDLAIGAPQDIDFFSPGTGYVEIRNCLTGALIRTLTGTTIGDSFGYDVAGAGDWNGDGRDDVIVGATQTQLGLPGYAQVFSGVDGSLLGTMLGGADFDRYGYSVAGLGDVDGDGVQEVGVSGPTADPNNLVAAGMADIVTGVGGGNPCPQPTMYCTTSPNSGGLGSRMSWGGSTSYAANDLELRAVRNPAQTQGLFIIGPSEAAVAFGDGMLCIGGNVRRIMPPLTTDANGVASRLLDNTVPIAFDTAITAGSTWKFQFWYRDPNFGAAGFNLSDAMSITFCP